MELIIKKDINILLNVEEEIRNSECAEAYLFNENIRLIYSEDEKAYELYSDQDSNEYEFVGFYESLKDFAVEYARYIKELYLIKETEQM